MQAVILAAGKGTRFQSDKAKVLHEISGKPLVKYVVELADSLGINEKIVVVGHQGKEVERSLDTIKGVHFAWQEQQMGTGHAVMMAKPYLDPKENDVLILYGDVPGLRKETLLKLIAEHIFQRNILTVLTAELEGPKWYGRILRDNLGRVLGIREAKDATAEELLIKEINSGIMVINIPFLLSALDNLSSNNDQKEYYLTDLVEIACKRRLSVGALIVADSDEIKGVNSVEELEEMGEILGKREN
ncbi:NTP transferase domain-containing protein [Candidatus Woesearchaeota archaeon]|nr:NTP transferase domain-containing protein [Candidatus Woesearchaeota archaeon]